MGRSASNSEAKDPAPSAGGAGTLAVAGLACGNPDCRRRAAGFSLLEALIAFAVLAILAGLIGRGTVADAEAARRERAAADVQGLAQALLTFEATVGQWPTLDAGGRTDRVRVLLSGGRLPAGNPWTAGHSFWSWARGGQADLMQNHLVVNAPAGQTAHRYPETGEARWRGPYLDACPLDPWGRPYVANVLATHRTHATDHRQLFVLSAGPDGRLQTAASAALGQRIEGDDVGCAVWQR